MHKAFQKLLLDGIVNLVKWVLNITWLMLPLAFHVFLVQMRQKIDTLPAITTYYSADSTWTTVYDGVVIVNTNPGALRARISDIKYWFTSKKYVWWVIYLLIILGLVAVASVKILIK